MTRIASVLFLVVLALPLAASDVPCAAQPLPVAKAWWSAFAVGDVAALETTSAKELSFTANTGRTFDRAQLLDEAATHHSAAKISMDWQDEPVRRPSPTVAVITTRVTETVGARSSVYRYLAVLECSGEHWQVAAAQSTRELAPTPRASVDEALLDDYAGRYATPAGKALQIVRKGSALALIDPSGAETVIEPIAPAVFEAAGTSFQGLIRFVFTRDSTGKIATLTRMTSEVTTFPRIN